MARTNQAYPSPEFRQVSCMVELVKSGRMMPNELAREYERLGRGPSATGWPSMNATEGSAATV